MWVKHGATRHSSRPPHGLHPLRWPVAQPRIIDLLAKIWDTALPPNAVIRADWKATPIACLIGTWSWVLMDLWVLWARPQREPPLDSLPNQ